jgi:hypothetical protein
MPETVSFRKDIGVIQVVSSDRVTGTDVKATLEAIEAISERHGIRRILVDARKMTEKPSTLGMFEALSGMAEYGIAAKLRFAVVIGEDDDGVLKFGEDVAQNRGVDLRLFEDRDEAMSWLRE